MHCEISASGLLNEPYLCNRFAGCAVLTGGVTAASRHVLASCHNRSRLISTPVALPLSVEHAGLLVFIGLPVHFLFGHGGAPFKAGKPLQQSFFHLLPDLLILWVLAQVIEFVRIIP